MSWLTRRTRGWISIGYAGQKSGSTSASDPNCWGQSFAYDRYGNLTAIGSTQCSSPTMSATVNGKNQVTNAGFTYDNGGNLISDGTNTYAWDAENRMASANGVTYTYDGDGKRVEKSSGTIYWYDASGDVLEETDASGNRLSAYIYFAGKRVGRYDPSGAHYAYLSDLKGKVVDKYIGAGGEAQLLRALEKAGLKLPAASTHH